MFQIIRMYHMIRIYGIMNIYQFSVCARNFYFHLITLKNFTIYCWCPWNIEIFFIEQNDHVRIIYESINLNKILRRFIVQFIHIFPKHLFIRDMKRFQHNILTYTDFGPVPNKDMKKMILFKRCQIFWKDAHCSENDFLSYFRFFRLLVFEIRSCMWSTIHKIDHIQYFQN